jgi:hypothetical protein
LWAWRLGAPPGVTLCGVHGTVGVDRRCAVCDQENAREGSGAVSQQGFTIETAAVAAAVTGLERSGVTVVELCPGDMTRYVIAIVDNRETAPPLDYGNVRSEGEMIVSLVNISGRCYGFPFDITLHPEYVAEKIGNGNIHTGEVVSAFLRAVFWHLQQRQGV